MERRRRFFRQLEILSVSPQEPAPHGSTPTEGQDNAFSLVVSPCISRPPFLPPVWGLHFREGAEEAG